MEISLYCAQKSLVWGRPILKPSCNILFQLFDSCMHFQFPKQNSIHLEYVQSAMIIFESILTILNWTLFFETAGTVVNIGLSLKPSHHKQIWLVQICEHSVGFRFYLGYQKLPWSLTQVWPHFKSLHYFRKRIGK
jgi:hypothetical protein